MALRTLDVLKVHGWHCPTFGVNVIPEVVAAMRTGPLAGSVSFYPIPMAALSAKPLVRHFAGDIVPRKLMLTLWLVTAATLDKYDTLAQERPLPDERELGAYK